MSLRFANGTRFPFFVKAIEYVDVATEDFSPLEDPSLPTDANKMGKYTDEGFLVRAQTAGNFYGITFDQYEKNGKSLTGLLPKLVTLSANQWLECLYIKIYAGNSAYPTTANPLNIGIIK